MTHSLVSPLVQFSMRPATQGDLPAIESLLVANSLPTVGVREALADFLVAETEDRLVGVAGMETCGGYGLLRSTAVATDWRGKGVARQLVERLIAQAEARGTRALYLLTTTAETYFPSFGFHITTRDTVPAEVRATGEFQDACPESATVMCLPLAQPSR